MCSQCKPSARGVPSGEGLLTCRGQGRDGRSGEGATCAWWAPGVRSPREPDPELGHRVDEQMFNGDRPPQRGLKVDEEGDRQRLQGKMNVKIVR